MPCWNSVGQMMPAMYCPDEMSASALPRRRSNQRLTYTTSGANRAELPSSPISSPWPI